MTDNTSRSLTASNLAAAIAAHRQPGLEEIQLIPTAAASQKSYLLPLHCQYTGILCGSVSLATTAGYLPLLSHWKKQQVLHPLFSLELIPLLQFAKNTWIRFCGFTAEEAEDEHLTAKQEQILQVAALAMIHHLSDVRQDIPWLPPFIDVQNNWQSLISLSYWKAYLDSQRFKFPDCRISKLERSIDLHSYIQACWSRKKQYETAVNEKIEKAKLDVAEKALRAIHDDLAGKRPRSTKLLWRWFIANLPSRYSRDADGWMYDLFTAKDRDIFEFTMADIDLFEEIFLSECPTGSSVSFAFLEILRGKRKLLENHFEAFEILVPESLQFEAATGTINVEEPKLADFDKRFKFLIAQAKWKLTHGNTGQQHMQAEKKRQTTTTVTPSFVPRLNLGKKKEALLPDDEQELAELDAIDYVAPDSVAATQQSDSVTGEYEE